VSHPRDEVLQTPLQFLRGVGPRKAADFARAGLHTIEDLLYRFPLRYEDRSRLQPIAGLRDGQRVTIAGEIVQCALRSTRRPGFRIFEALVRDASGAVRVVWFNSSFLKDQLRPRMRLVLYGMLERNPYTGLQFSNPEFEIIDDEDAATLHTNRIVPIYERARSITPKMQRRLVAEALERLPRELDDPLPASVLERLELPDRLTALERVHFPAEGTPLDELNAYRTPAQRRLIFEEFFRFQVGMLLRKRESDAERKLLVTRVDDRIRESLRAVLPFHLTAGQRLALKDIAEDMQRPQPMNRLLQGDVGAGKTIVAVLAAMLAMENGQQVAMMAPTEILAEQHFATVSRLLAPTRFRVALVTGSLGASERRSAHKAIAAGEIHLVVGTHALVQRSVRFSALGLVIIDEQHRFGVMQRAAFRRLRAATEMADHLAHDIFPASRVALLHGRMKPDAKDRVMRSFAAGEIQVLVSTTVIEVGIDVPNATVILIDNADRFGLSQLHLLRGRVGRSAER
jgi:ATP-dependent DNA helicase RecG